MRAPAIWFDATTLKRFRHESPVGLSRMEAHVLAGALTLDAERVGFCSVNRYNNAIERLARSEVEELLGNYGQSCGRARGHQISRRNPVRRFLREVERRVRIGIRKTAGQVRHRLGLNARLVRFKPGDTFVLSGATWNMVDAAALEKMLIQDQACLVALLADMIPWRFPHHFQDEQAVSNFLRFAELIARRASLVLSISRNTHDDFAEFAAGAGISPGRWEVVYPGADAPVSERPAACGNAGGFPAARLCAECQHHPGA